MKPTLRPRRPIARTHRGFTIVEAVVVMSILAAVGSVVSGLIFTASRSYTDAATTAQLQSELSMAMARLTREVRYIPIDASQAPVVPRITSVTATSIAWDPSSSISLSSGNVQLILNGATPEVLLQNGTVTVATYNQDNSALASTLSGAATAPVRRVEFLLSMTRNGTTQTLRSRVFLRGLMSGS